MIKYEHGADIYSTANKFNVGENKILDFSSNINPLGIPTSVKEAYLKSLEICDRYPDPRLRKLSREIGNYEKISQDWIFISNGASEAIYRIVLSLKPQKALLTAPTFGEYEEALNVIETDISYYYLKEEKNFDLDEDFINFITNDLDILFICNPNNPTGRLIQKGLMISILKKTLKTDTYVVVDESFMDFFLKKIENTLVNFLESYSNLIVLKSFTKIYSIPGIRLGYCLSSNTDLINNIKKNGPPWNISAVAEACGITALKEKKYIKKSVDYIKIQRDYLIQELINLGFKVYDSKANYILFRINKSLKLKELLEENYILIRSCSNYKGLNDKFYRIAVKNKKDNDILIDKLKKVIK
ncbi:MAG: threonine-phosphate decarboxylase CobD [Bacillota bacterium]|nr:threonine-phosphate decarboxylase CobD [Bacillota bacterium]